jgi:hypothetical protein
VELPYTWVISINISGIFHKLTQGSLSSEKPVDSGSDIFCSRHFVMVPPSVIVVIPNPGSPNLSLAYSQRSISVPKLVGQFSINTLRMLVAGVLIAALISVEPFELLASALPPPIMMSFPLGSTHSATSLLVSCSSSPNLQFTFFPLTHRRSWQT